MTWKDGSREKGQRKRKLVTYVHVVSLGSSSCLSPELGGRYGVEKLRAWIIRIGDLITLVGYAMY